MCLAVGTNYYLWCLGSPSSSSSLAQLTYMVRAPTEQKVEADVYGVLNLELTEHHFSCSEFAWHHFCFILSMQITEPVYIQERRKTTSWQDRQLLPSHAKQNWCGDVMIRRGVKQFTFQGGIRLTDSVLRHNGRSLALEYQSKLIMRQWFSLFLLINAPKKATYYITTAHITLYCKDL